MYAHSVVLGLVTGNSKSAHLVSLLRDQWYRRYRIHKDSIKFRTWIVILTLKTTNKFLHKTSQLIMMYHPIKFGCKKISTSADMIETVIFDYISPRYNPKLEDSKPIFLHDTLAIMMHHHSNFVYRRFSNWGDIVQMNSHWNFESLLWPWPKQSNPIFSQDNPAKDYVLANQV